MSTKIHVPLPEGLLEQIDMERKRQGLSREQFLRGVLINHFDLLAERVEEAAYVDAYQTNPEQPIDAGLAQAGFRAWADLPWEESDPTN